MRLIELPRRHHAPRTFIEPAHGLDQRVSRALDALGNLPDGLDLPGFDELAGALIAIADELHDPELEDDEAEDGADDEAEPLELLLTPAHTACSTAWRTYPGHK